MMTVRIVSFLLYTDISEEPATSMMRVDEYYQNIRPHIPENGILMVPKIPKTRCFQPPNISVQSMAIALRISEITSPNILSVTMTRNGFHVVLSPSRKTTELH